MTIDFSDIAAEYEKHAVVQKSASEILLKLLNIGDNDDVLDLGCGTGSLARKIRGITKGRVVGIDPSPLMIKEAIKKSVGLDITYEVISAEELNYKESFDVIVCNSAFQWFRDPRKSIQNCYEALRYGGRIGIQAPAGNNYCPNFIRAVEAVREDERTRDMFLYFKNPWFLLESEDEYKKLFESAGFRVGFSVIEKVVSRHTPEEVLKIFMSGAAAGYLNQRYYNVKISGEYIDAFVNIVKESFEKQAENDGMVKLEFNRLFLIGVKEGGK